jgi:hypothetical protein
MLSMFEYPKWSSVCNEVSVRTETDLTNQLCGHCCRREDQVIELKDVARRVGVRLPCFTTTRSNHYAVKVIHIKSPISFRVLVPRKMSPKVEDDSNKQNGVERRKLFFRCQIFGGGHGVCTFQLQMLAASTQSSYQDRLADRPSLDTSDSSPSRSKCSKVYGNPSLASEDGTRALHSNPHFLPQ